MFKNTHLYNLLLHKLYYKLQLCFSQTKSLFQSLSQTTPWTELIDQHFRKLLTSSPAKDTYWPPTQELLFESLTTTAEPFGVDTVAPENSWELLFVLFNASFSLRLQGDCAGGTCWKAGRRRIRAKKLTAVQKESIRQLLKKTWL